MKHQRAKDKSKILTRMKEWNSFGWGFQEQFHRLWKRHWLTCNCGMCRTMRVWKRLDRKRERRQGKLICRI